MSVQTLSFPDSVSVHVSRVISQTVITYKMLFSGLETTPFKMLLTTIISGSLPATVSDFVTYSVMQVSFCV